MATIRSYTDLKQSRKLAKILPLESADMGYNGVEYRDIRKFRYDDVATTMPNMDSIPCWSLAALLGVLPKVVNNETLFIETSSALWHIGYRNIYIARADNPVDACYEMIIKLHELNLL